LTNDKKDLRVRWVPGSKDPGLPNVVAGQKEGSWQAAPGYRWASSNPKDLRVVRVTVTQKPPAGAATAVRTGDEAKQRAVGKIVGAFLLHAGGSGKTDDPAVAVAKALALRLRDELVESALKDFNPALKDHEVRAGRRVICLLLEERLSVRSFGELALKEELIVQLKKADPKVGGAADLADFIAAVNQAWARNRR
jgi:hypothetical protein